MVKDVPRCSTCEAHEDGKCKDLACPFPGRIVLEFWSCKFYKEKQNE